MSVLDKILKIVHIITRLILGGAQENTLITCRLQAERGNDVTLITGPAIGPEGDLYEKAEKQGYKIITIDPLRREINPFRDIKSLMQLNKILGNIQPDVVHTHSAKAGILGRLAGYRLKRKSSENLPAVIHTIHGLAFHPYQPALLNRIYIMIEKLAAKWTDHFISVADAMTEQAKSAGIGTDKPYTTAYSAIEEEQFLKEQDESARNNFRQKYNIPADSIAIVTIARLFKLKGHKYILQSAKELAEEFDNVVWVFVGSGNLAEKLKTDALRTGLENRIIFTGLLAPEEIPTAIKACDILVHCSLREGLARALPQGMLCGKPVVSFDVDGAKEVVNKNTGRLVPPKDTETLIDKCRELIKDENLRKRLGQTGREFVKEKFAPEIMVDVIDDVYKKVMEVQK
jgi:glycosyltransferase involved in cell wall biosynthesis